MNNPFELINSRLKNIEKLVLGLCENIESSPVEDTEKFLNVQETAKFLGLSEATIYTKVCKRTIPFMKQGKKLYFSSHELHNYVKSGKPKSFEDLEKEAEQGLLNNKKGLKDG